MNQLPSEKPASTENPWTTLSSKCVYENAWIRVREDQVRCPNGEPGIYGVVETAVATGVVALGKRGQVVLVGQYRYPTQGYSWEIVEGAAHKDEAAIDAVRRELREEAGLVAQQVMQLGPEVHLSNSFTNERAVLFLAWELTKTDACPDVTEVLSIRHETLDDAVAMVRRGDITDAMSVIALERAQRFLQCVRPYRMEAGEV